MQTLENLALVMTEFKRWDKIKVLQPLWEHEEDSKQLEKEILIQKRHAM